MCVPRQTLQPQWQYDNDDVDDRIATASSKAGHLLAVPVKFLARS